MPRMNWLLRLPREDRGFKMEPEEREEMIAEINMGQKCREFINSDVGRYLLGRAKLYREELFQKFRQIPHDKPQELLKLQSLAQVPELFEAWLAEQIEAGEQAQFSIESDYDETTNPDNQEGRRNR